jgi:hypothetical protein
VIKERIKMIQQAIDMIGSDKLEELALSWHKPIVGNYVIVKPDRSYKVINERRMEFNSKYCGMDYYSGLVSMNKPVASKLITSNNIYTFFCKNTQKLTMEDTYNYYDVLELPEDKEWYRDFVRENIKAFGLEHKGLVKIFFPGTAEEYRTAGLTNWYDKSISKTKYSKGQDVGAPIGYSINPKKPYMTSQRNIYLVSREQGVQIKIFYDILKGMYRHGYNTLYLWDNNVLPVKNGDMPDVTITGGIMFAFKLDDKGQVQIIDMDTIPRYEPHI